MPAVEYRVKYRVTIVYARGIVSGKCVDVALINTKDDRLMIKENCDIQ